MTLRRVQCSMELKVTDFAVFGRTGKGDILCLHLVLADYVNFLDDNINAVRDTS